MICVTWRYEVCAILTTLKLRYSVVEDIAQGHSFSAQLKDTSPGSLFPDFELEVSFAT